jgi:hypothetical protein
MTGKPEESPFAMFVSTTVQDGIDVDAGTESKTFTAWDGDEGGTPAERGKDPAVSDSDVADDEAETLDEDDELLPIEGEAEGEDESESEDEDEDGDEDEPEDEDEDEDEDEPKPRKKTARERISQLTKARREAERALEDRDNKIKALSDQVGALIEAVSDPAKLEALRAAKKADTPAPAGEDVVLDKDGKALEKPDPEKFQFGELDAGYTAAVVRYEVQKTLTEERRANDKTRQQQAASAERSESLKAFDARAKTVREKFKDFDDVVVKGAAENKWPLSETLGKLIAKSEHGPEIAYRLGKNPTQAKQVYGMSDVDQAAFFGRIEAQIAAKAKPGKKAVSTQAPPPPRSAATGKRAKVKSAAASSDFAAFEAEAMSKQRK